jgi:hypothetical protein
LRKLLAVLGALLLAAGTLAAACTSTLKNADYGEVGSGATATLVSGTSGGITHTSAINSLGDLIAITAWCFPNCTNPTVTVGNQVATGIGVHSPGTTIAGGLTTGQAYIFYVLAAQFVGSPTFTLIAPGASQTQVSYMDFQPSSGCVYTHDIDAPAGTGTTAPVNAPTISGITGDLLFNFTVSSEHVTDPLGSPWSAPTYNLTGESQSHYFNNTVNGAAYVLAAATSSVSNNWTTIHSTDAWESVITSFKMTQLAANSCNNSSVPAGVTTCWYVAAGGSDSNAGTFESVPWLHAPGMPNCSGACATEWTALSNGATGTGIILRGGDTWHFGNSGLSPFTGIMTSGNGSLCDAGNSCGWAIGGGAGGTGNPWIGTTSNPIYIGVDPTWSSASTWARPKMNGDNTPSTSAVASCGFNQLNFSFLNAWSRSANFQVDNFEWLGLCTSGLNSGNAAYIDIHDHVNTAATNRILSNNYEHGWTHTAFNCPATNCNGVKMIGGPSNSTFGQGDTVVGNVADGSDTDQVSGDGITFGIYDVHNSYFGHMANAIISNNNHTSHDNLFEFLSQDADGVSHTNVEEHNTEWAGGTPNTSYNQVIRNCFVTGAGEFLQFAPNTGVPDYFGNSVMYNMSTNANFIDLCGGPGVGSGCGTANAVLNIINDTLVLPNSGGAAGGPGTGSTANLINTHFVVPGGGSGSSGYPAQGGTVNATTNLYQTPAQATAQGYTASQSPAAYFPTTGGATIGAGTSQNSFCNSMVSSSDPLVQAAGNACLSGSKYSCVYNAMAHTMTCPVISPFVRGSAWDAGAFEFSNSGSTLAPPTNLHVTPLVKP